MKWVTIWAIQEKIKWNDMAGLPTCGTCKGEYHFSYHLSCTCRVPQNWVWPHEIYDMLRLIRHKKFPDWIIKE